MQMSRNNTLTLNDANIQSQFNDVYAGITPSASAYNSVDESKDMLSSIQQKLGNFSNPVQTERTEDLSDPMIMPSETTMRLGYQRPVVSENTYVQKKSSLSVKAKVSIGVYTAVVMLLILAVTLCGLAITNSFNSVASTEAIYAEKIAELEALKEIINADNYDELLEKATEMGFVQINDSNSYEYTQLETRPAQNYNVKSNWFNDLCEWFSGIFGR